MNLVSACSVARFEARLGYRATGWRRGVERSDRVTSLLSDSTSRAINS